MQKSVYSSSIGLAEKLTCPLVREWIKQAVLTWGILFIGVNLVSVIAA